MNTKSSRSRRSSCPVNLTLEILGDNWSLLIVRDLMLLGRKTFNQFLNADEGIASNILTDRLQRLEANGIVSRQRDIEDGRRIVYRLTKKGIDLAPLMAEIMLWAAQYENTNIPPEMLDSLRSNREQFIRDIQLRWHETNATSSD